MTFQSPKTVKEVPGDESQMHENPLLAGLFANPLEILQIIGLDGCHREDRTAVFPVEKSPLKYRVNSPQFRQIRGWRFFQLVPAVHFNAPSTRTAANCIESLSRGPTGIGYLLKFGEQLRKILREISHYAGVLNQSMQVARHHH